MAQIEITEIKLTGAEIRSGSNRQRHAELLILQLPKNHDGRNTWLLNYGTGDESKLLRKKAGIGWDDETQSAPTFNANGGGTKSKTTDIFEHLNIRLDYYKEEIQNIEQRMKDERTNIDSMINYSDKAKVNKIRRDELETIIHQIKNI